MMVSARERKLIQMKFWVWSLIWQIMKNLNVAVAIGAPDIKRKASREIHNLTYVLTIHPPY
jgi:hypothetical protein